MKKMIALLTTVSMVFCMHLSASDNVEKNTLHQHEHCDDSNCSPQEYELADQLAYNGHPYYPSASAMGTYAPFCPLAIGLIVVGAVAAIVIASGHGHSSSHVHN